VSELLAAANASAAPSAPRGCGGGQVYSCFNFRLASELPLAELSVAAGDDARPLVIACLGAVWMLRRRGVSATLHFGAAREEEKLIAHVWVTVDGEEVVGCESKDRFFELARFPGAAHSTVR